MASARNMRPIHHFPMPERSLARGAESTPEIVEMPASGCVSHGVPTAGVALARWPST